MQPAPARSTKAAARSISPAQKVYLASQADGRARRQDGWLVRAGHMYIWPALATQLPNLEFIVHGGGTLQFTDRGAAHLARLPKVVWQIDAMLSDDGIRCLADSTNPQQIRLANCELSDAGIGRLCSMGRLLDLEIVDTDLRRVSLQPLAGLANLSNLAMIRCQVDERTICDLADLPYLDLLVVEEPGLTDQVLASLLNVRPTCGIAFVGTSISPRAVAQFNKASGRVQVRLVTTGTADPFDVFLAVLSAEVEP